MDIELDAHDIAKLWRERAQNLTGTQLWHANYMAALCEQCEREIKAVWLATYHGDGQAEDLATQRWDRTLKTLQATFNEQVSA